MTYGLVYGLSAYGLAQQLQITPDEAKEQMEAYFARFGGVRDYLLVPAVDVMPDRDGYNRDDAGPSALSARPDVGQPPAPARWPSGWR